MQFLKVAKERGTMWLYNKNAIETGDILCGRHNKIKMKTETTYKIVKKVISYQCKI